MSGPREIDGRLLSWASEIGPETMEQARIASRLPILAGPIALMPDAHLGKGATVGSVIATEDAVIPSAVGVDIGCGMIAVETTLRRERLPDDLDALIPVIEGAVPAGLGRWHDVARPEAERWLRENPPPRDLSASQIKKTLVQLGTLGSGNHFFEMAVDERGIAWIVLHSGSRGVGNQLATEHIRTAKLLAKDEGIPLEDPDLAWLQEGTPAFDAYIRDMLWAQRYAMANRSAMMDTALPAILRHVGTGDEARRINCHHNFAQLEEHGGREVWVTRKGAIKADIGDLGVIPGAMGGKSFIVEGRGNERAYRSCAHGAGRRLSRNKARKLHQAGQLEELMAGRAWQRDKALELLDEIPSAYKDVDRVMADQADLVRVLHVLEGILNYKGTS